MKKKNTLDKKTINKIINLLVEHRTIIKKTNTGKNGNTPDNRDNSIGSNFIN